MKIIKSYNIDILIFFVIVLKLKLNDNKFTIVLKCVRIKINRKKKRYLNMNDVIVHLILKILNVNVFDFFDFYFTFFVNLINDLLIFAKLKTHLREISMIFKNVCTSVLSLNIENYTIFSIRLSTIWIWSFTWCCIFNVRILIWNRNSFLNEKRSLIYFLLKKIISKKTVFRKIHVFSWCHLDNNWSKTNCLKKSSEKKDFFEIFFNVLIISSNMINEIDFDFCCILINCSCFISKIMKTKFFLFFK